MKRNEAVLAITLTVMLVAGIALIELPYSYPVPQASTFSFTTTSSSVWGLALVLSLNSTNIHSGQSISIRVDEQNTLPPPNHVPAAKNWPLDGLGVGPCGVLNYPMGIQVMQGYYGTNNVSTGSPLQLYKTGTYNCPAILSGISGYTFQSNDTASVTGSCGSDSCFTQNMSSTTSVSGYWTPNPLQGATFRNFLPGIYTVVAGDEWETLAVLHFVVQPSLG